jgi:hypothetical protein
MHIIERHHLLQRGGETVTEEKYCDYCGEVIYIGDTCYVHKGMRICKSCAKRYAWAVFEEEARIATLQYDQLLSCDEKDI